jgi:hypothetical protein
MSKDIAELTRNKIVITTTRDGEVQTDEYLVSDKVIAKIQKFFSDIEMKKEEVKRRIINSKP